MLYRSRRADRAVPVTRLAGLIYLPMGPVLTGVLAAHRDRPADGSGPAGLSGWARAGTIAAVVVSASAE